MDVIVIEATNTNNKEDKNEQQQPSPKSFEQSNYTFNDESLLNLINVNANKYKTSNLTTSQENDESLDHLNDLYLKEFLLKLITHLDMSHLKLTKTQTQNNINNKQRQQINSDVFIKVSVKSGNDNSTLSSPLSSSSSSSSSPSPSASQQHEQNLSASSNETTKATLTPEQKQTKVVKQVIRLYDEAWSNFEKLRNVYALEVCLLLIYLIILKLNLKKIIFE